MGGIPLAWYMCDNVRILFQLCDYGHYGQLVVILYVVYGQATLNHTYIWVDMQLTCVPIHLYRYDLRNLAQERACDITASALLMWTW